MVVWGVGRTDGAGVRNLYGLDESFELLSGGYSEGHHEIVGVDHSGTLQLRSWGSEPGFVELIDHGWARGDGSLANCTFGRKGDGYQVAS